ncbi:DUF4411 family protein [Alicyclobacillus sendaiensis]|uniref:DUF4411 family protein n=1 Tax=Alicyclobacillus sendaiensis PA2 TaxID=3029425 RepID=A0ABT6Y1U6_ALISE|nr:DUF4411 family protein [Alicyclobacillus sendaiensis]MDI9261328.1 DUF4411 family protein [Alicyclobacillus sendaiensis PA2]
MTQTSHQFVIDSSVLIEAHRRYYAHDLLPGFWDVLANESRVCSIDRVFRELENHKDWLAEWAKQHKTWFLSTDNQRTIDQYVKIVNWVNSVPRFNLKSKKDFFDGADSWLCAYASAFHLTVVTQEISESFSPKVKIPDVCDQFGIPCINTFEMLRALNIVF